jgi:hypothetical protein
VLLVQAVYDKDQIHLKHIWFYGYYEKKEVENVDISLIEPFLTNDIKIMIKEMLNKYEIPEEKYSINSIF